MLLLISIALLTMFYTAILVVVAVLVVEHEELLLQPVFGIFLCLFESVLSSFGLSFFAAAAAAVRPFAVTGHGFLERSQSPMGEAKIGQKRQNWAELAELGGGRKSARPKRFFFKKNSYPKVFWSPPLSKRSLDCCVKLFFKEGGLFETFFASLTSLADFKCSFQVLSFLQDFFCQKIRSHFERTKSPIFRL